MKPVQRSLAAVGLLVTLATAAHADGLPPADQARGLENPDAEDPADAALLVPRVVLGFPRIAFDIVTLPINGAAKLEDRYHVSSWLEDLLYNDARTAAIIPILSFETFRGAGGGVLAFHDDLFGGGEHGHVKASYSSSGSQLYEVGLRAGAATYGDVLVRYQRARDLLFEGVGADGPRAYFGENQLLMVVKGSRRLGPFEFGATGIYDRSTILDSSVAESYPMDIPTGLGERIDEVELQANLALKTRPFRLETFAGRVTTGDHDYWHWGAEAEACFELWAPGRELHLRAAAEGVNGDDLPFVDLPTLGGPYRLRGYEQGRFRGTTAELGTIEYRYPVHQYVSGALYVDAGHVTDGTWHAGGGTGLIFHSKTNRVLFTLQASYGDGFQVFFSTDPLQAFTNKDTAL